MLSTHSAPAKRLRHLPQWRVALSTALLQDMQKADATLTCMQGTVHPVPSSNKRKGTKNNTHLFLDAVVELVYDDLVTVVLAANHVHTAARKGVPGQKLQTQHNTSDALP